MTAPPRAPGAHRVSRLLLGASLALVAATVAIAVSSAVRARANSRQLLRDYASFAAWTYSRHLDEALGEVAWYTLNPIGHRETHTSPRVPRAASLPQYLASGLDECRCEPAARPRTYFRFSLRRDLADLEGPALAPGEDTAIVAAVRRAVGQAPGRNGLIRMPSASPLVAYGLMPTAWGDTVVYGFTFDSTGVARAAVQVLAEHDLLPAAVTGGRPSAGLFVVELGDSAGRVLYRDPRWPADEAEWPYIATEWLARIPGGLAARVTLNPATAYSLLDAGFPAASVPLLVLIGVLGLVAAGIALHQVRREAALARLRSDFVAGVSHELRTPLAQIRLFLDTLRLKRYDTPVEQEWLVGHLERETTRLEHLVENVLAVTRLERGVLTTAPLETLDLGAEVRAGVDAFRPLAASRQARLRTDLGEGILVRADRAQLRQLLLNLLDNAVKFGPPGQEVAVEVAAEGPTARLTVADAGPGVPEAERERIFQPYYRGQNEATRAVGGSGIGLAVVRETARRFGGEVRVTHGTHGGARFSLALPRAGGNGHA